MSESEEELWRALASPWRRRLLDLLRAGPLTTGRLAQAIPELSRFAVMQHLDVLTEVDLVVAQRIGRHRYNHLNPVPLRRWYERWVVPLADESASQLLALQRHLDTIGATRMTFDEQVRTVRIETQLRFDASPERVFAAITGDTTVWFPHSYGGELTKRVVIEPRVGGAHYEDWGDGQGYLYGHVTQWQPPNQVSLRGRVMPGSILDTAYEIAEEGAQTVLRMSKVATGPMTEEEAAGISHFGDIANFADELRKVVES
jgi:DNA-binding transcriptional ArsR family regulator/uncharacterized protein YndB with AHSA1/START domain